MDDQHAEPSIPLRTQAIIARDDDSETEAAAGRRRRLRTFALVGGAVAVVAAAALVIAKPWASDGDGDAASLPDGSVDRPDSAPDDTLPEPAVSNRWLIDPIPEGLRLTGLFEPGNFIGDGPAIDVVPRPTSNQTQVLLRGPDASYSKGPWLAVSATLLDRFERANFDPMNFVDPGQFDRVNVGESEGALGNNWDSTRTLIFGLVNDGFVVSMSAKGVDDDDLVAIARELTLDENDEGDTITATPILSGAIEEAGLEPFLNLDVPNWGGPMIGLQIPALFGDDQTTSVDYTDEAGNNFINVTITPQRSVQAFDLARFIIDDDVDAEVHGVDALAGSTPPELDGRPLVMWIEGGRVFIVRGEVNGLELTEVAETLKEVDEDAWAEALASVGQGQFVPAPIEWLVNVGEYADGVTWIIEASSTEERINVCSFTATQNASSTGCSEIELADKPTVVDGPGTGLLGNGASFVAFVPVDQAEGVTMRYVGADGVAVDIPLKAIQPDWPVLMAAWVPPGPGTAELIGADGTVLASQEFDENDTYTSGLDEMNAPPVGGFERPAATEPAVPETTAG